MYTPVLTRRCLGTSSRFLIKQITEHPDSGEYTYDWQYLSFISLFYQLDNKDKPAAQILLCFDLTKEMRGYVTEAFMATEVSVWRQCPLGAYSVLIPVLTRYFDKALWQFRKPIREIEKASPCITRLAPA